MSVPTAHALTTPELQMTAEPKYVVRREACPSREGRRKLLGWLLLPAALSWSCGATDGERAACGAAGEAAQEPSGGRLCAPECTVFCGTKEECSPSSAGEGGKAP
jgi:hypothetical protein